MNEGLVSVIVAVYNVEQYLENCIKSICAQEYQELQILLVDDGSRDKSGQICDEWARKDQRITVLHQKNGGVSRARNEGIEKALGRYVIFVDSDDYLERDYIRRMVEAQRDGYISISGYFIDIEMEKRRRKTPVVWNQEPVAYLEENRYVGVYKAGLFNAVWNKMYEVRVLKEQGLRFDETKSLGEDALFNLAYFRETRDKFCVINKTLYHYMKRGLESLDNKYCPDFYERQIQIFEEMLRYAKEIPVSNAEIEEIYGYYFNALVVALDNLYCNRKKMDVKQYRSLFRKMKGQEKFHCIVGQMTGKRRMLYSVRRMCIQHGFYRFDYSLREMVKRLAGMK